MLNKNIKNIKNINKKDKKDKKDKYKKVNSKNIELFINALEESLNLNTFNKKDIAIKKTFIKILFSKKIEDKDLILNNFKDKENLKDKFKENTKENTKNKDKKNIFNIINKIIIKLVKIKGEIKFCFLLEYKTKHITKNFILLDGIKEIREYMKEYKNIILYTSKNNFNLNYNKKGKSNFVIGKPTLNDFSNKNILNKDNNKINNLNNLNINKTKKRLINIQSQYLKDLGIIKADNSLINNKQSKFRQINKYLETINSVINNSDLKNKKEIIITDMGSGKGYLTFAIYDFLRNILNKKVKIFGIEMRDNLIELCNNIAESNDFKNLKFIKGDIINYKNNNIDLLIALHACDTATDDAIFKGITAKSSVIITSPCCHKQIRKELNISNILNNITKHGILKERLAENITDTMRGLILEYMGYKVRIFEYIADEHTHKNIMIIGVKKGNKFIKNKSKLKDLKELKKIFGIKRFYLEELIN